jgi:hypothetical protein
MVRFQTQNSVTKQTYSFLLKRLENYAAYTVNNKQLSFIHIKVKFSIEQATKAQRGCRCIALLFFNLGARWGWLTNATLRPLYPRERPSINCKGGWVGLRHGLGGCGKSGPHRDSITGPTRDRML